MAAMDFIHKQLVGAAGRDALSTMGMGAGMGAGLGAANALITGNDSLIGGATSGALLGAGGGAAMRYAGAKYGAGIAAQGSHANRFDHQIFSKAEKPFDFMGNSEANQASFNAALKASPNAGAPAAEAAGAVAGKVTSEAKKPRMLEQGTNLVEHQQEKQAAIAAKASNKAADSYTSAPLLRGGVNTGSNRSYAPRAERLARENNANAVLANRKPTVGMEDVPQHQLQYMSNTFAPKLNNEEIRKGIVAKNASKIQKPGYTSQQEINNQWSNQAAQKSSQMDDMWNSIGL